ncbi:MAG: DUF1810 domain-containing protein [Gammaproteobacteria bacterium]|nr:DUF1810 domain-containing protein [Gammaproteobacteria bacterium]
MDDPYNLSRFVEAQEHDYADALAELKRGKKSRHWIWYIFPQIAGLGYSEMSQRYAISSVDEASAYIQHRILGARLVECTETVIAVNGKSAEEIFGSLDAAKFRSSMTLFAEVSSGSDVFRQALVKYFDGKPDPLTGQALRGAL